MKSKDEARLNMYETVYNQGLKNPEVIATIKAFEACHKVLGGICTDIRQNNLTSSTAKKGAAKGKQSYKNAMINLAIVHAGALAAFADASANNILFEKSNLSATAFEKASNSEVEDICKRILNLSKENTKNLEGYGINSASISNLEKSIEVYHLSITNPRELQSQAKAANANIRELFKQGNKLLKNQMDKLVKGLKANYPDYVAEYISNREIVDAPTTSTSLSGQVLFEGIGIKGKITISDLNLEIMTDEKGQFQIKPIAFGFHTIIAQADDPTLAISTQENVQCKLGKNTTLNIELKKK